MSREKCSLVLFVLLLGTCSVVFCDEVFGMRITTETSKTKENTHYRFHYFVKDDVTGDYKTQEETKEGDSVRGSYTVADPNGDLRTVTYKAEPKTGFNAKVDVKPTASPIRTTKETTQTTTALFSDKKTTDAATTGKGTTVQSNVQSFPGGFIMDVLKKPQTNTQTEMGMTFSLNTNFATEPVTSAGNTADGITTEKAEITLEPTKTTIAATPTEGLERQLSENSTEESIIDDLIEKELDEVENSMPKLPELIFPDKTHFKFYKDPEEAILDERITQIARQLAETSLRREYEERKLGHFIPISVTSIEPITSSHLSKSFKFTRDDTAPPFRPTQASPIQVLTHLKLIPQYIYKEPVLPTYLPANQRLPIVQTNKPLQWEQQTYETVTNVPQVLKINKSELQVKEINKITKTNGEKYTANYDTTDTETVSVVPIHIPTFLQFISTSVKPTENYFTQTKTEPQTIDTTVKNLPTEISKIEKITMNTPVGVTAKENTTTSNTTKLK